MDSAAWRSLSGNAVKLLLHVSKRFNGINNGQIVYACRDAREIGLSRGTAARALSELIETGFLKITRDSAFRMKSKEAREWALTFEDIGTEKATKDFMRWEPPENHSTVSPVGPSVSPVGPSHQNLPEKPSKKGVTVSPVGPSEPDSDPSQSHPWDTSISTIPKPDQPGAPATAPSTKKKRPLQFGDRAKAERIARNPMWVEAINDELAERNAKPATSGRTACIVVPAV